MFIDKIKNNRFSFLIQIAYRNIYRNIRRSLFSIVAIALAVLFIIIMMSYIQGMLDSVKRIASTYEIGDIRLYTKDFEIKKDFLPLQYPIEMENRSIDEFVNELRSIKGVKAVFKRIATPATLLDSNVKHGIAWGININEESKINYFNFSKRNNGLLIGRYPHQNSNECAIGIRMARKLKIIQPVMEIDKFINIYKNLSSDDKILFDKYYKLNYDKNVYNLIREKNEPEKNTFYNKLKEMKKSNRKKPIYKDIDKKDELNLFRIFINNLEVEIIFKIVSSTYSDKFYNPRLTGIFDFDYALFDTSYIIVPYDKLSKLAVLKNKAQSIFVFLNNPNDSEKIAEIISDKLNSEDILVKEWRQHEYLTMFKQFQMIYYIFYGVFIIIASFLIVNTIIMIIYERLKEIGMMGALGMNRKEIVIVFFMEALVLSLFGAFLGTIVGGGLTFYLSRIPINIEALTGGIDFPTGNIIYIRFSFLILLNGFLYGVILSSLCTILPSLKSAFIEPVEALRK